MCGSNQPSQEPQDEAARGAAIAIIEGGNAAPSPQHNADESTEQQEVLRRLAVEIGRSVDA